MIEVGAHAKIVMMEARRFPLDGRYCYFDDEQALHRQLDQLVPDLVEVSSPWTSAAMVARWPGHAPRTLIMHADPLSAYAYRWFGGVASRNVIDRSFDWFWQHLRRLDDRFDAVISASNNLSARLRDGGLNHVITNPMGVEPGIFSPHGRDEALRARLLRRCGLPKEAVLLLGVGRLASEKRWPMVIDAVTAAGVDCPIGLVLIGNGRDRAKAVRAAADNPHVQLLAPVTDRPTLARIMASADALVHGCEAETFCMVASEAKASGLPLIVPDAGGAADQLAIGQGQSYVAGQAASLARAIKIFVADNPEAQRRRAVAAAMRVRSMDTHFDELFSLYRTLVTGNTSMSAMMRHAS